MELVADPGVLYFEFFFQFVDNALADIAERSDIVGKYFDFNHSHFPLTVIN
jgi:hypothetical protein